MQKTFLPGLILLALASCAGCFTLTESPRPETEMTRPSKATMTVAVKGFDATVNELVSITGVQTVWTDRCWHDPWYGSGGWETVPVSATMSRSSATDVFREQARNRFEDAGWRTMAQTPDYVVEVKFSGPVEGTPAFGPRALRVVGTLFFSDKAVLAWSAKLRIYDNRTGALLLTRDYVERDEESMWSPILILGPLAYAKTDYDYMRLKMLSTLTNRTTADASAFLAGIPH